MVYRIPRELTIRRKEYPKRNKSFKNNKKNVTNNNRHQKKWINTIMKTREKSIIIT